MWQALSSAIEIAKHLEKHYTFNTGENHHEELLL